MEKKTKQSVALGAAIAAIAAAIILCIAVPLLCTDQAAVSLADVRLIAHRGYSAAAPENSLAAFRLAGDHGFWGAECDIQQTADGQWIVMHDDDVDRTTDGAGPVRTFSFSGIRTLHIDSGNGLDRFPNEKVPTLTEYLDICREYGIHPVIEIKKSPVEQMDGLAALLSAREEKERFVVISFSRDDLARIKQLMPQTEMYLLTQKATRNDIDFCLQNGINGLDFKHKTGNDVIRAAQDAGLKTVVWTIDSTKKAARFLKLGVDGITTNALLPPEE